MKKYFSVGLALLVVFFVSIDSADAASTIGANMSTTGTFTLTTGSATAAQFQNAAGTVTTFIVDTTSGRVGVGAAPSTTFEVQGTASASYLFATNTLQIGGSVASVAYNRFGTAATTHVGTIAGITDLIVGGGFEVNGSAAFDGFALFSSGASISTNFEVTGNNRFGINAGGVTNTTFEVGGTASISGIASVSGNFAAGLNNVGTSSFNFDAPSATQGGCFRIKDNDGSGYTYLRVSNGVGTFSTVDCR